MKLETLTKREYCLRFRQLNKTHSKFLTCGLHLLVSVFTDITRVFRRIWSESRCHAGRTHGLRWCSKTV